MSSHTNILYLIKHIQSENNHIKLRVSNHVIAY